MSIWRAPGRVNLIGEHTDYNDGLVLPMAIGLDCRVQAEPASDGHLRAISVQLGEERAWPVESIAGLKAAGDWGDHVAGVAWELARRGYPIVPQRLDIDSEIPIGGGLSSSAALGVSIALALLGRKIDPLEMARICRAAETDFAGVPCGIMDQFASAHGGAALLDCRSLESRPVTLPAEVAVVAVNSMVKHDLAESAYKTRVEECREAAGRLGLPALRDARVSDLARLDGAILKRARHVVTENLRVEQFLSAASSKARGRLLVESHASLRDDYEVSCRELDFLVEAALRIRGVFGARMTGGGFGGCTVNLVDRQAVPTFENGIRDAYRREFGITPAIYLCEPAPGAGADQPKG